jgi:hypothetical protein
MTERTVTEQQVIKAMANAFKERLGAQCLQHSLTTGLLKELFPELPEVGEVVLVWDNGVKGSQGEWFPFVELDNGVVMVTDRDGDKESWDNYRRQTEIEKGEK